MDKYKFKKKFGPKVDPKFVDPCKNKKPAPTGLSKIKKPETRPKRQKIDPTHP